MPHSLKYVTSIGSKYFHWIFLTVLSRENSYYLKFCKNIIMWGIYMLNCLVLAHDSKTLTTPKNEYKVNK